MDRDETPPPRPLGLGHNPRSSSASSSSTTSSLKPGRIPRFAEATSVHSPIEPAPQARSNHNPFSDPELADDAASSSTTHPNSMPEDVGFGYVSMADRDEISAAHQATRQSVGGGGAPLKSALKSPAGPAGGKGLRENPLSPTFAEEAILEKREQKTAKQQKRDLLIKTRVRMAKFALRGVNFSCSLIVLSMLSTSFAIVNATRSLPGRSSFTPWSPDMKTWPQILVLTVSCISLAICIAVFFGYVRRGHRRAEKVSAYYTLFAIGWFVVSMIIWLITAALYSHSRNSSGGKDMWGWSCTQNGRSTAYQNEIDFSLVCRLQNWSLICIVIEIVVEAISFILYSIVFYRVWSKRRLHKSMDMRDKARSDLYLAQLRTQSAPNTPGFQPGGGPRSSTAAMSPSQQQKQYQQPSQQPALSSPRFPPQAYQGFNDVNINDGSSPSSPFTPGAASPTVGGWKLQHPPAKAPSATPRLGQGAFPTTPTVAGPSNAAQTAWPMAASVQHANDNDDEPHYESVAIPGAYADAAAKTPAPYRTTFGM